ncbi:N-acetylglucosamine kinase [Allonocardiopsis opalescens]|uniref:N-acetylglucosamine kinase-like BadF-type ATPase n=1 Tax=Allonocardiopsis opalescens TaxID=1144618 RepID=A0A2T0PVY2_9ACTN|nr:BadF/BadG/BcrA/BcrD ATPase family protein [Allonocardiopsis opalescens]PRX95692.1 N-acetylglucosamine kinase-like BadF-type ATPase [Allonocardiopsis opalescens]
MSAREPGRAPGPGGDPTGPVVVGVDAGGTTTRCVAVGLDGVVVGAARAAGANQNSSADPSTAISQALLGALGGITARRVVGGVVGMAGAGAGGRARAEEIVGRAWSGAGLRGAPRVGDDIVVAFAAGTTAPHGTVMIAGTGAVTAALRDGEVVRRCDGYGWLLGDEGSAVWLGREAVRAALASWDGRGPATTLSTQVPVVLGTPVGDPQPLIRAVYDAAPADLGAVAPVVSAAAAAGDPVACEIVDYAAHRLVAAYAAVRADPGAPTVLAGSVLRAGPVATVVRRRLREEFGAQTHDAADGALGAAALALRAAGADPRAHARLLDEG